MIQSFREEGVSSIWKESKQFHCRFQNRLSLKEKLRMEFNPVQITRPLRERTSSLFWLEHRVYTGIMVGKNIGWNQT